MDQAKIRIECRCKICQKEIVSEDYVDPYKDVTPAELLYRNGGLIDIQYYLSCEANGKESTLCIMDIPELCRECQQKISKALKDACDNVLHELLPCSLMDRFKRMQEDQGNA